MEAMVPYAIRLTTIQPYNHPRDNGQQKQESNPHFVRARLPVTHVGTLEPLLAGVLEILCLARVRVVEFVVDQETHDRKHRKHRKPRSPKTNINYRIY